MCGLPFKCFKLLPIDDILVFKFSDIFLKLRELPFKCFKHFFCQVSQPLVMAPQEHFLFVTLSGCMWRFATWSRPTPLSSGPAHLLFLCKLYSVFGMLLEASILGCFNHFLSKVFCSFYFFSLFQFLTPDLPFFPFHVCSLFIIFHIFFKCM